jgi:endonuclease G
MLTPGNAARTSTRRRKLRQVVGQAFTPQSLARALAEGRPARQLTDHVSAADFQQQTFELIDAAFGFSWSSVITASEWIAARRTITVVAAVQNAGSPLTGLEVFSEVAASDESKAGRIWKLTSQQSGEAILDLRPNAFYRFGVKMPRLGTLQEGAFFTRLIKEPERIEFDVRNIPDGGWLRGGEQRAAVGVVQENEPVSPNLTAAARTTIQKSTEIRIASPDPQAGLRSERGPLGLPPAPWVADRLGFTLGYDPQRRRPVFTAYLLDGSRSDRLSRSSEERFIQDPALPREVQPRDEDFRGSGYDRGHLVRTGDIRTNPEAVQEAYYLSSVVPQTGQSNRMSWLSVEQYTTTAAESARVKVWILSGPVYRRSANGKERVLVLGEGATPVPTDLFRILLRRSGPDWNVQAFLVPNDQTVERNPLTFATSVDALEKLMGTNLLPNLPPQLKTIVNINDWRSSPAQPSSPPT